MNITEKLSNLLFLQGKLEQNLEMQISFLLHDKVQLEKILNEKQETLETEISTLREEIELQGFSVHPLAKKRLLNNG